MKRQLFIEVPDDFEPLCMQARAPGARNPKVFCERPVGSHIWCDGRDAAGRWHSWTHRYPCCTGP